MWRRLVDGRPVLSIRLVLVALGGIGVLIAAGLAGFGLLATQQQLDAQARVVYLDHVVHNHATADAFMDDVRADVMRALLSSFGANKEDVNVIKAELRHHIETVRKGIAENASLFLEQDLHSRYASITDRLGPFAGVGQDAVALALTDPAAGSANFEAFRRKFSALEQEMDATRDVLEARVQQEREDAAVTAMLSKRMIMASLLGGLTLLALITAIADRLGRKIAADLAKSREEAHHLAAHDPLTGLPNRAFFSERLEQELADVRRHKCLLAVLCLDLDRFKQVNDTFGHAIGDALLRAVAARLRDCLRRNDTVARIGGDEFAIIQSSIIRAEEAALLARRIVEALSEPYDLDGHQAVIGVSVGIAIAPADTANAGNLVKMGDLALYRAKADGRGVFRFFEAEMDSHQQARRFLELDLRRALAMQELEVHYQPLVDLTSGQIDAVEALVRWRHTERGLVQPDQFIPLAEETGLIDSIGAWVLTQACAEAAGWPANVRVAVNISAEQFKKPGLVAAVADALAAAALPPRRLELEITETALLADSEATIAILEEFRAMGVRIAMDDFGTGYSSLSYLRSFLFDKIKIDRSFIHEIETSADCRAIVRAVTGLGGNLGMSTTAEGVETEGQLAQLRSEGCDQVQGYLFSRPVPAHQLAALFGQTLLEPRADAGLAQAKAREPETT